MSRQKKQQVQRPRVRRGKGEMRDLIMANMAWEVRARGRRNEVCGGEIGLPFAAFYRSC